MTDPIHQQLADKYQQMMALQQEIMALQAAAPKQTVEDYALTDWSGAKPPLSALFGAKDDLILIHNMGFSCPYCTMWADGFNAVLPHIEERAAVVLTSPDDVSAQKTGAEKRGWTFRMLSNTGTSLNKDMGFEGEDGGPMPGCTVFHRNDDGTIVRYASAPFGPGDKFCSVFSFFELLPPEGENGR